MVDHRADEQSDFRVLVNSEDDRGTSWTDLRDRASNWLFGRPDGQPVNYVSMNSSSGSWLSESPLTRFAAIVTAIWVFVLGAYGVGFYLRLGSEDSGARLLPTVDLLFFAFAIAGPVAMLWIVVMMLTRAARLTDAITGQSDSALALAATLNNLNDSIDVLSAGTTGRLEQACDRMEREASASVAALDRNMREISQKLETALLESVTLLDQHVADRVSKHETEFSRQQEGFDARLKGDAKQMASAISAEVEALRSVREHLSDRIDQGRAETQQRLEKALNETLSEHQAELKTASSKTRDVLAEFSKGLAETSAAQAMLIEHDLAAPIREIRTSIDATQKSISAHPPASAQTISELLGETARRMVAAERSALDNSISRIADLEAQARTMLAKIDRTSRLNPLMGQTAGKAAEAPQEAVDDIRGAELPFAELPRALTRSALNWTAAVHVLDGTEPQTGTRHMVERAASDPDLAALIRLGDAVAVELAEDKIYPEDLKPDHASAELWARYGRGERGGEIAALGGDPDEISTALIRARLRASQDFHALTIRFAGAYGRLIERASSEIGADPRLTELAETRTGRLFLLLAGVLGAFQVTPGTVDAD